MPVDHALGGNRRIVNSPGRTNLGSEYMLYDPYRLFLLYVESACIKSHSELPNPSGYPTWFPFFDSDSDSKVISEANLGSFPVVAGSASASIGIVTSEVSSYVLIFD